MSASPPLPPQPLPQPLPIWVRRGLLGLVVGLHIVGGWALSRVQAARLIVGEVASMEVRMVPAETPAPQVDPDLPLPDLPLPDEPPPLDLQPPEMPKLETQLDPPPPDLPPPVFPVAASPPPPPPPPKPQVRPQPRPPVPVEAAPQPAAQPAAPQAPAAPRTVTASQVQYLEPPSPVYPARSKRANEQGTVMLRVLVDIAGRAAQVSVQTSSRHPALDEAALVAVRNARFRPFMEGGAAQPVWVLIPINFVLQ